MNKVQLYKLIQGKECTYYVKGYDQRDNIIKMIIAQITDHNDEHNDSITYEVDHNTINISNGQFIRLPIEPKSGVIDVKSTYILCAGVRIDKSDIIEPTEDSFKTVNGTTITYK